jgi:hypothetical protein
VTGPTLEQALEAEGDPMRGLGPIDHLGIVATDIRAAMNSMGALYGLPWTHTLVDAQRTYVLRGETVDVSMNVGHIETPTPLEFVGALEGTVWEPRHQPYLHHVAYKVSDFQRVCEDIRACGGELALTLPSESAKPVKVAYFEFRGLILELLDATG